MTNLEDGDRQYVWHPSTQHMRDRHPLGIVRGEGAYIVDESGRRILDAISSWWVTLHGHSHPKIAKAIADQAAKLEHVMFGGFTHEPAVQLAERLISLLPGGFGKVFYSDNGTTAVEVALKMAIQYWRNRGEKRDRFLCFEGGYHGDCFGAMSVGNGCKLHTVFDAFLFSVDGFPYPETWDGDEERAVKESRVLSQIEEHLKKHHADTAALIIEPLIQGSGGMRMCSVEFLQKLESLAKSFGILSIYDEAMTGFGRTGQHFACTHTGAPPDIICLAKGLTGGFLPLAATVCRNEIYDAFLGDSMDCALFHGHSYTANPLGCAAALASMELLLTEATQARIARIGAVHVEGLGVLMKTGRVEKARHYGTVAAVNLTDAMGYGSNASVRLRERFLDRGVLIRPIGAVVYLLPPYCISDRELMDAYELIAEEIRN